MKLKIDIKEDIVTIKSDCQEWSKIKMSKDSFLEMINKDSERYVFWNKGSEYIGFIDGNETSYKIFK
jgi:hypothetical protein